jgi:hypothetical protein
LKRVVVVGAVPAVRLLWVIPVTAAAVVQQVIQVILVLQVIQVVQGTQVLVDLAVVPQYFLT